MENLISATNLQEISYPVFRLGTNQPTINNGLVFYYYENYEEDEDGEINQVNTYRIVDDKNIPFQSLAMRRLAIKNEGVKLFKITNAIFFLGDLIKLAKPNMWFIDSKGKIFNYSKTIRALLKFHKIAKNIPIKTGGSIIEAEGIITRFKSLFSPDKDKTHVGILHFGKSLILYGFYTEKHKDTWRMI